MAAAHQALPVRRWPDTARWAACFALALGFHAAGAAALFARWGEDSDLVANAPVVMIELAPVPVSPNITPNELPPGPQQSEAEPEPVPEKPIEKVELPPDPKAEPLAVTPPPKPIEKPKENRAQPSKRHSAPPHRCQELLRAIPTQCQTGNRSLSQGSSVTSAIPRRHSRGASAAWRNLHSASIAAGACTMRASSRVQAQASSIRKL